MLSKKLTHKKRGVNLIVLVEIYSRSVLEFILIYIDFRINFSSPQLFSTTNVLFYFNQYHLDIIKWRFSIIALLFTMLCKQGFGYLFKTRTVM